MVEPHDIGGEPRIGEGIGVAGEPRPARRERHLHPLKRTVVDAHGGGGRRPVHAHLDAHALAFAARRIRCLRQVRFQLLRCEREKLVAEGERVRDRAAGGVQSPVRLAGPAPHRRPFRRVGRAERRRGKGLVEIFADQRRFEERKAVMHQGRHHAHRVERHVGGRELVALAQVVVMFDRRQPLLAQHQPDLGRAHAHIVVVQFEHRALPPDPAQTVRPRPQTGRPAARSFSPNSARHSSAGRKVGESP